MIGHAAQKSAANDQSRPIVLFPVMTDVTGVSCTKGFGRHDHRVIDCPTLPLTLPIHPSTTNVQLPRI